MKKISLLLLGLCIPVFVWLSATLGWLTTLFPDHELFDGPYVMFGKENQLKAQWVCAGVKQERQQAKGQPLTAECGYAKTLNIQPRATPLPQVSFKADKLAALSDIHGQFSSMTTLLQKHGIIDAKHNWIFGQGHLVIAGDVMSRGPAVTESLWFLYQLEQQAQASGGQVHLLLGNHETMSLAGDVRYLHPKYLQVEKVLKRSYAQLYGADTVLGDWLRSRPVLVKINDSLFVHAGLHPDYLALGLSMTEVNEHYRASLGLDKKTIKQLPLLQFLYGSLGPLWYRGYFRDQDAIQTTELNSLLHHLSVARIVVGHTSMDAIYSHQDGQILSLDSNIKKGSGGELLLWQLPEMPKGVFMRGDQQGRRLTVMPFPQKSTKNPI